MRTCHANVICPQSGIGNVDGVALFIALTRTRRTSTWSCGRTPGLSDESFSLKIDAVSRPECPCVAMFARLWKRRDRWLFARLGRAISPSVDAFADQAVDAWHVNVSCFVLDCA